MKYFAKVMICALLVLFTVSVASAEVRITQAKLIANKINLLKFGIMNISNSGKVVTAYEKVANPKLKQQGTAYRLWIFEFKGDSRDNLVMSSVLLPCSLLQNAALSPDGKTCVITAERGSKFIAVDIPSKTVKVLFEHKKGTPGFRADSGLIQYYDNEHLGSVGYFYDNKDRATARAIALIDPTKTGNKIFREGYNSTKFEYQMGDKAKFLEWCDVGKCFFVMRVKGKNDGKIKEDLCYLSDGRIKILASADVFLSSSCGKNTVVYTCGERLKKNKVDNTNPSSNYKNLATYAYDVTKDHQPVKLTNDGKLYSYIATAKDGSAAIISDVNLRALRVTYLYGTKESGFKMKPIKGLEKTAMSQLRLAPDGKAYVTWDGIQIIWGKLK